MLADTAKTLPAGVGGRGVGLGGNVDTLLRRYLLGWGRGVGLGGNVDTLLRRYLLGWGGEVLV